MVSRRSIRLPASVPAARPHWLTVCGFAVGASAAMSFLSSLWGGSVVGWLYVGAVGVGSTALWLGSGWRNSESAARRWIGRLCLAIAVGFYGLWAYLGVAFGSLLGWTVPAWGCVLLAMLFAAALLGVVRGRQGIRIPLILPVGLWIAAVLSGWVRQENLVRCDDYFALPPTVQLVVANPVLARCQPGEVVSSGRFPRTLWQAPEGDRVVFTTQGRWVEGGISGAVCEASLDGRGGIECVGLPHGKSQGLIPLPEQDRLLAFQWGLETPTGAMGAKIFELPLRSGITILGQHWVDEMVGDGYFEPADSVLYVFSDRMNGIHRFRIPGMERLETIPSKIAPGELVYDRATSAGVACGHRIGVAIGGNPYSERSLVGEHATILDWVSTTWGCDWDPLARKVYSTTPNLGLLVRIDYETGRVEDRWFVGLGQRSVAYDRVRRRVYFTDFLRGYVTAFDEASERIVGRWFVGRFSRWVALSPDGNSLLATGNLGIVRIPLAPS